MSLTPGNGYKIMIITKKTSETYYDNGDSLEKLIRVWNHSKLVETFMARFPYNYAYLFIFTSISVCSCGGCRVCFCPVVDETPHLLKLVPTADTTYCRYRLLHLRGSNNSLLRCSCTSVWVVGTHLLYFVISQTETETETRVELKQKPGSWSLSKEEPVPGLPPPASVSDQS